jgi:predicted transcriptional regulator
MKLENVIITTPVARLGATVRDVVRSCVEAGVRAIPYCNDQGHVIGLCSLKEITRLALLPDYMIEAANALGNHFHVLDEAESRIRKLFDQPMAPFVGDTYVAIPSTAPLMKAVALINKHHTDYAFVIDDHHYHGLITVYSIAKRMLQTGG